MNCAGDFKECIISLMYSLLRQKDNFMKKSAILNFAYPFKIVCYYQCVGTSSYNGVVACKKSFHLRFIWQNRTYLERFLDIWKFVHYFWTKIGKNKFYIENHSFCTKVRNRFGPIYLKKNDVARRRLILLDQNFFV